MKKLSETAKVKLTIIAIIIVAVLAGFLDGPKYFDKGADWANRQLDRVGFLSKINIPHFYNVPFHLGLDLQGGTHLVYRADVSKIPIGDQSEALEGVRDVIERRVNAFGVAEPLVQTNKTGGEWRVIVELAGIKDVDEAIKMIGETPLLEFKEENTEPQRELTAEEQAEIQKYNTAAKTKAQEALSKALKNGNWEDLAKEYSEDENTKQIGGDLGFLNANSLQSGLYLELKDLGNANKLKVSEVYNKLIELDDSYNVVKVDEIKQGDSEAYASHILICYKGADICASERSKEEALAIINELKAKATTTNFINLAKENSDEPGADTRGGDLGWFGKGMMVPEFENAVFNMEKGTISDVIETQFGYHLIYLQDKRSVNEYKTKRILITKKTEADYLPSPEQFKYTGLSGKQLTKSQVVFDPNTNAPQVKLEFNDEGKNLFAEITKRNVGKVVGIFLDGDPISLPTVQDAILDGNAVITGDFTIVEAKQLSQRLNAGALPVPIELINQQTVGASLGKNSLQKSLFAGLWGLICVSIYMIVYYRLKGIVAVAALLIYTSIVLAVFKLVPITLTLAGIAGFILSIGMAADANVLIFERMKEEKKAGRSGSVMIDEGFKRAWPSIRDGNASTLITCVILFWFGTSVIKGFALTLIIGVLLSMFSAITVSKMLLKLILIRHKKA